MVCIFRVLVVLVLSTESIKKGLGLRLSDRLFNFEMNDTLLSFSMEHRRVLLARGKTSNKNVWSPFA